MYDLSPRVERIFRAAGWSESRAVDGTLQPLAATEGYGAGPVATEVLVNCAGLRLVSPEGRVLDIDPQRALFWLPRDAATYIHGFMGEPACPLGYGETYVLLLGVNGSCALLKDDWLGYVPTANLGEALERFFFAGDHPPKWRSLHNAQRPPEFRDSI